MITKEQVDAIQANLSGIDSVTVKVNSLYHEAAEYAGQLFSALSQTGWRQFSC
jgi:hypothetical protein